MWCDTLDTLQGPIIHQSNLLVSQAFFHTSKPQSGCQASRSQKRSKECKTHVLSRQRSYIYIWFIYNIQKNIWQYKNYVVSTWKQVITQWVHNVNVLITHTDTSILEASRISKKWNRRISFSQAKHTHCSPGFSRSAGQFLQNAPEARFSFYCCYVSWRHERKSLEIIGHPFHLWSVLSSKI